MALASAYTAWEQVTTWATPPPAVVPAPSEFTAWAEATAWQNILSSASAFTAWLEAITWEDEQAPTALPSAYTGWAEATTWEAYGRPAYRRVGGVLVKLDYPQKRVDGAWAPLDLPDRPEVPEFTVLPSPFTPWVSASFLTWRKPLIGVIAGNESAFNTINAQVGYGTVRRSYNTVLPPSWAASAAASDVQAGRMSLWSWKPDLLAFPTSTAQKNAFSDFLDTIPAGHECVIMAWHEPENDIPGSYSLAQWGALQNAVATIVKSKGRPELRTGFCLMGPWTFDTRSGRTSWTWEAAVDFSLIDVVGIDPYSTTAGSNMTLETLLTVNNSGSGTGGSAPSMMAKLKSWGKPISIMEFGKYYAGPTVAPEADVALWIRQGYAWMKEWNQANLTTPIESALWYSMTILTPPEDTPLTGLEITAYAEIVADSKIPV